MAGEIQRVQTSDGVDHLIDYNYLANRPDIDGILDTIAAIISALEKAGITVDTSGSGIEGTTLTLEGNGYTLSDRKLVIDNQAVGVDGKTLVFGGGGASDGDSSVSGTTLSMGAASVSGRKLVVDDASVSNGKLTV